MRAPSPAIAANAIHSFLDSVDNRTQLAGSNRMTQANGAMGRSMGVDAYVPKFDPIHLADTLRPMLRA